VQKTTEKQEKIIKYSKEKLKSIFCITGIKLTHSLQLTDEIFKQISNEKQTLI